MNPTHTAIIIVLYKAEKYALQLINSLEWVENHPHFKLYIQDNSPEPIKSVKAVGDWFTYRFTGENIGFGRGVNAASKLALSSDPDSFLLINPDLEISQSNAEGLREKLLSSKDEGIGAVGPKVYKSKGRVERTYMADVGAVTYILNMLLRSNRSHSQLEPEEITKKYVDNLSAGCVIFSREVFESVSEGMAVFDPDFFMYFEDNDLCRRIRDKGFKLLYSPDLEVLHHLNQSSIDHEGGQNTFLYMHLILSSLKYYKKHYRWTSYLILKSYWLVLNLSKWLLGKDRSFRRDLIKQIYQT